MILAAVSRYRTDEGYLLSSGVVHLILWVFQVSSLFIP